MTRSYAHCLDCGKKMTRADRELARHSGIENLCEPCYDYAGWENTHSDWGHDQLVDNDPERDDCPVCHPELDRRGLVESAEIAPKGAAPRSWSSHKGHAHPMTQGARKACREGRVESDKLLNS